jgi:hypothetical protein
MFNLLNLTPEQRDMLLGMGAGLLSGGRNNGEAISRGLLMGANQRNEGMVLRDRQKTNDLDRQMRQQQLEQQQGLMADRTGMRNAFQTAFQQPNPNLVQNDDQGFAMPQAPGGGGMPEFLKMAGPHMDPLQAAQMMQPKPQAPLKVNKNERVLDPQTYRELVPAAPDPQPDWMHPDYQRFQLQKAREGRSQVTTNVMPPREIFKDSLSLKKDFDAQPEVKGFKEVQGAWDQISTALADPSAANDLAAATKFMKLLDPGSVVRESELAMAMQATGALDRFTNMGQRIMKGHKLTPSQRDEFRSAGEALYNASKQRFGETVGQYEGIAQQYGLDAQFLPKQKAPDEKRTVTIGGKKMEARVARDGKTYVKMGDKYYEVQE